MIMECGHLLRNDKRMWCPVKLRFNCMFASVYVYTYSVGARRSSLHHPVVSQRNWGQERRVVEWILQRKRQ